MNRMIALWAHPRSRSTALERVFIERGDFEVFHEPFAHMAFDAHSAIPCDGLDARLPTTYEGVKALLRRTRERRNVFHKDMGYHCIDELKADREFMVEQQHVFIIREPGPAILSHYAIYPQMPVQAIGHQALYVIFCQVKRLTGKVPFVINAEALIRRPEHTVRALCDHLQLEFLPASLHWQPACPEQWRPWRRWHHAAALSTGLSALHTSELDDTPLRADPRLRTYFEVHQPYYECLNRFAQQG